MKHSEIRGSLNDIRIPDCAEFVIGCAFARRVRMGGANGSRECAPDDKLHDTHQLKFAKMMGYAKGSTHPTSYTGKPVHQDKKPATMSRAFCNLKAI